MTAFVSVHVFTPSTSTLRSEVSRTCAIRLRPSQSTYALHLSLRDTSFLASFKPITASHVELARAPNPTIIKCDTSESSTTLVDQKKTQNDWQQKLCAGSVIEVWGNKQLCFGVVQSLYDRGVFVSLVQVTADAVILEAPTKVSLGEVVAVWPTTLIAPSADTGKQLITAVEEGYKLLRHAAPRTIDLTTVYTAMWRLPKMDPRSSLTAAEICHALFRPHPNHPPHRRAALTVATAVLLAADSIRFKRSQPGQGWRALPPSVTVSRGRCSFIDACHAILDRRRSGDHKPASPVWSREQLDILRDIEVVAASGTIARGTAATVLEALGYTPNDDGAANLLLDINYWATGKAGHRSAPELNQPTDISPIAKFNGSSGGNRRVTTLSATADTTSATTSLRDSETEWSFTPALLAEARDLRAAVRERKRAYMNAQAAPQGTRRRSLLHPPDGQEDLRVYCIDDKSSRFLDDAISIQVLQGGSVVRIMVHVADVDEVVRSGSALDEFARERGQSLYLPLKPLHMLPPAAMDAASFSSTCPTEAITVMLECDLRRDFVRNWEVFASIVPPVRRVSYDQFDTALEHGAAIAQLDNDTYSDLKHIAQVAPLLAEKLDNRRSTRKMREARRTREKSNDGSAEGDSDISDMFEDRQIASVRLLRRSDKAGVKGAGRIAKVVNYQRTSAHQAVDNILTCTGGVMRQFARENRAYLPEGRDAFLYVGRCGTAPLRRYGDLAVQRQIKCILFGRQPAGKRRMDELKTWLAKRQAAAEKTVTEHRRKALFDSFSSFCAQKRLATGAERATVRGQVRNVAVTKRGTFRIDVSLDGTGLSSTASIKDNVLEHILKSTNDDTFDGPDELPPSNTNTTSNSKTERLLHIVRKRLRPHTQVQVEIAEIDTVTFTIQACIVEVLE